MQEGKLHVRHARKTRFLIFILALLVIASSAHAASGSCASRAVGTARTLGDAADVLACQGRAHGLVVVGDFHGTRQIPAFVGDVVAAASRHQPVRLGLEMPTSMQAALNTYLDSRGNAAARAALLANHFWDHNDGRQSQAMLALIERMRELRTQGRKVRVFLMVPMLTDRSLLKKPDGYNTFKENGMARAIRDQLHDGGGKALVVAYMGNWHTRYNTIVNEQNASTLEQLTDLRPVLVDPDGWGTAWVCKENSCGVHSGGTKRATTMKGPRMYVVPDASGRVLEIHVRMPPLTASLPGRKGTK